MSNGSDSNTPPASNGQAGKEKFSKPLDATSNKIDFSPRSADSWLTEECHRLLGKISQNEQAKKRQTIIIIAHSRAAGMQWRDIFNQFYNDIPKEERAIASEQTWFTKWQYLPDIAAAYEACRQAAADSMVHETAAQIAEYRRQKQLNIARFAALGPAALSNVMANKAGQYKGAEVINAVKTLFEWDDPNTGMTLKTTAGSLSVDQTVNFAGMTDQELAQIAGGQPPADSADSDAGE